MRYLMVCFLLSSMAWCRQPVPKTDGVLRDLTKLKLNWAQAPVKNAVVSLTTNRVVMAQDPKTCSIPLVKVAPQARTVPMPNMGPVQMGRMPMVAVPAPPWPMK